jgi:hypothetical protein
VQRRDFYTYTGRSEKYMIDLVLELKDAKMTGLGADGIDLFVIFRNYFEQEMTSVCGVTGTANRSALHTCPLQ